LIITRNILQDHSDFSEVEFVVKK